MFRTEPSLPELQWQLRLEPGAGGGVATLVLDRPEKLNAWSREASRQLARLAARVRFEDNIRVLVVRGSGRAFCAGVDLGLPEDRITGRSAAERARNFAEGLRWVHEQFHAFATLPQPINDAAANFPVPAARLSPNGWRAVTDIVLDGTFLCSRELHHRCTTRRTPGAILNILATQALTGGPGPAHAAAAKAAVGNLTKSLAAEWGPDGIRVNALAPGLFPHEDVREDLKSLRPRPDTDARRQPAFRTGRRHELGWAATYLCSPFAAFLTGHTLVVDGGNHLRRDFVMPPMTPIGEQLPPRG